MQNTSELEKLKLLYYEILRGYSYNSESSLYIKHFSEKENHLLLQKKLELCEYYEKEGVPTEKILLKNAIENGEWSEQQENRILELKYAISDNEKYLYTIIQEQRHNIERMIERDRVELQQKITERKGILGRSIEDLVEEEIDDYITYLSFYKDENISISIETSYEKFQEIDQKELNKINTILSRNFKRFSEDNLRYISCMPFFINKLSLCKETLIDFLGKPISELTHNQSYILNMGIRNLNVLSRSEGHPPELNLEATPEQVAKWYDIQHSILLAKSKEK